MRTAGVAVLVLGLALALSPRLRAHQFQTNMYPDMEVTETGFVLELWIATFLFPPLSHIDFGDGKPRPTVEEAGEAIVEFFDTTCPIAIDDQPARPVLEWLKFEEMEQGEHLGEQRDFTFAKMRFVYGDGSEPRRVNLRWGIWFPDGVIEVREEVVDPATIGLFPDPPIGGPATFVPPPEIEPDGAGEPGVQIEIVSHDPNVLDMLIFSPHGEEPIYLTPDDPEVTWHAPMREFADTAANVAASEPAPLRMLTVPLAPIFAGAGLLAFVIVGAKLRFPAPVLGGGAVALAAVGLLARDALPIELPHPAGGTPLPELNAESAKEQFLKLHRGIYRAFEAESEDAIYNRLAASVDGPLLDRLYQEVYHSLIMRSEGGGALSRVSAVDYIETTAADRTDGGGFDIACTWRVNGVVRHWGHAHRRTNEYQADYVLAPRGDRWTIADATVNLQKRVPNPRPKPGEQSGG